jgi:type I restriction enzyme R subunit
VKNGLTERDIVTKFIIPALVAAGWDLHTQIREEVTFTKGRIIVRGKLHTRGATQRADCLLYFKPNIPIGLIEAKDANHAVGAGMQQGLNYGATLDIPFVYSSNGSDFLEHDRTGQSDPVERELSLETFPSPAELWAR